MRAYEHQVGTFFEAEHRCKRNDVNKRNHNKQLNTETREVVEKNRQRLLTSLVVDAKIIKM
jgi:hypothetical protein